MKIKVINGNSGMVGQEMEVSYVSLKNGYTFTENNLAEIEVVSEAKTEIKTESKENDTNLMHIINRLIDKV